VLLISSNTVVPFFLCGDLFLNFEEMGCFSLFLSRSSSIYHTRNLLFENKIVIGENIVLVTNHRSLKERTET